MKIYLFIAIFSIVIHFVENRCSYLILYSNLNYTDVPNTVKIIQGGELSYILPIMSYTSPTKWQFCVGSLIKPTKAITVAFCVVDAQSDNIIIAAGYVWEISTFLTQRLAIQPEDDIPEKYNIVEVRVRKIHVHPKFNKASCENNIALLSLNSEFPGRLHINIGLLSFDKPITPRQCEVVGWGYQFYVFREDLIELEGTMSKVETLFSIPEQRCLNNVKGDLMCVKSAMKNKCICDLGSPIICNGRIFGLKSHFIPDPRNPVGVLNDEHYYTGLYPYKQWVKEFLDSGAHTSVINPIINLYFHITVKYYVCKLLS